jgi:hypothetical protein
MPALETSHGGTRGLRRDAISAATATAAEALDGAALDLSPATLAELLMEVKTLAGWLDLVLDRLAGAVDPVGVCR